MTRALAFVAALVALLVVSSRMERTTDLSALLPSDGELGKVAAAASAASGTVVLEVDGSGTDLTALRAAVAAVEQAALASQRFESVRARVDPLLDGRALQALAVRHAVELTPEDLIRERTTDAGIDAALQEWRARLAGPASAMAARGLREDPLDLGGLVLAGLRAPTGTWDVHPESGLLLDASGKRALILGRVRESSAEDTDLVRAMEAIVGSAPLPTRWFGGPRIATDMARSVQRDIAVTSALGIAALLAVMAVGFRSVRALLALAIPLAAVLASIGAVLALRSPIHGISLGFGGALTGIAADYWIHLHVSAAREYSGQDPALRLAAAQRAWREIRAPLSMVAATTVAAFGVLLFSAYPVVRDLGAAGIATIAAALGTTGLVGPLAFRWTGGRDAGWTFPVASPLFARAMLAGTVALAWLALSVRFDGDPRHLIAVDPETSAIEREFTERYGGVGAGGIIVAPDLDAAAEATHAVSLPGVAVSSPTRLVPGPALEARRRAALPALATLNGRVAAAATRAGISPGALLPAIARYYERAPVTPATWDGTPLADVVARSVQPGRVTLDIVLADPAIAADLARRLPASVSLVVPVAIAAAGVDEIRAELAWLGGFSAAAILALLIARYRDPARIAAAAFPVVAAFVGALGVLSALDWPLDAVGTSVLVLVLGLSVDYGIFMADGERHATGVVLSALTSIGGFGAMIASRSTGLASAGLVVMVGLGAAVIASLVITPRILDGTLLGHRGSRLAQYAALAGVLALNVQVLILLRFVVPSPVIADTTPVALPTGDERRIGSSALVRSHGIWVMSLSGTPAEMGLAHGRLAADLRARLEDEVLGSFTRAVPNPLARASILEGVFVAGAGLDAHIDPRWREEIAGLVASTPDRRGWLLPGYTRKLYFHALHDIGQMLVDSPLVGCTGFLATGAATTDGHTLLARNFDFEAGRTFDDDKVVIVRRPERGFASVSVAFAGMVGVVSGMNERGIALALQAAGSDAPMRLAEPMTLVLREALEESSSLDDVERILDAGRGFGTELVLAADGKSGEIAVFEVTPARVERLAGGDLLSVSNHLRSPVFAHDQENARRMSEQTTVPRLAAITALTEQRRGTLDLAVATRILQDRGEDLPRGHRHAIDADIASHGVAFDATARVLWVSAAPNVSGGFVSFSLDEILGGALSPREVVPPTDVGAAMRTHRARDLVREASRARPDEAIRLLREALQLRPDHPEVLLALAERTAEPSERRALVDRIGLPETARDRDRLAALRGPP